MGLWRKYRDTSFVLKMSLGFILGIIAGIVFGEQVAFLKPFGVLLIRLLSLIAIPVIFLTVVISITQMNVPKLGRLSGKLILYYVTTTAGAVLLGLVVAFWINPGAHLTLPDVTVDKPDTPNFSDILTGIVPDNLFAAFSEGNLLSILFFAVIMGIAISIMRHSVDEKMQEYGALLEKVFAALNEVFYKILNGVLLYAPIGVFAIGASSFAGQGLSTFQSLLKFTGAYYLGIALLWVLVYSLILKVFHVPVWSFFKQMRDAYSTAFFTSSSIASLPVAIKTAKKYGVSETVTNFSLPLGAVFNSDGGALRMGVSLVFAANITELSLSPMDFLVIVLIGTLLSVGTAGVPAAGLVTLSAVLTLFGLPLEIVALIAGVDVIIGMAGTASNVMGDMVGAVVVDKHEKRRMAHKVS